MNCKNCGASIEETIERCPSCGSIINEIQEAEVISKDEETKDGNGINDVLSRVNQNSRTDINILAEQNELVAKKKKKLIIAGISIVVVIVAFVLFVILTNGKDEKETEKKKEDTVTDYAKIMTEYGNLLEIKVKNYIIVNNAVPKADEILATLDYNDHNISCNIIEFYNDRTIYLSDCSIDNSRNKYSYGINKEEMVSGASGKIYVLKDKEDGYIYTSKTIDDSSSVVYTYECTNKDCSILDNSENHLLILDDKTKIFDYKTEKLIKEIDLSAIKYEYASIAYYNNKIYGLVIYNDEKYAFYSTEKDKLTIGFEYDSIDYYNSPTLPSGYVLATKNILTDDDNEKYIYDYFKIDISNGKVLKSYRHETNDMFEGLYTIGNENNIYFILNTMGASGKLYNENFEFVISDKSYDNISITPGGNIVVAEKYDSKKYDIYNSKGEKIFTSREYNKIFLTLDEYVVVLDTDGYLKIVDLQDNIKAKFIKWKDNLIFHYMLSGDYKNGIYLLIEEEGKNDEGICTEYYWEPSTNKTGSIKLEECGGGYAKPVLYLYPKLAGLVTINFEKPDMLTTTYPKFIDKWTVFANKNGDLYDLKGNYYYALYWEEKKSHSVDFSEGFYVTKDNAIEFLEEKLDIIGLNAKERNEFIMYWLPILEKNGKSLVYFELTEERDSYNKLIIKPKPDSLLRIAMHVKKVNSYQKIKEQKLKTFDRKGFVAVEWGGVLY
jgi:hypothetical protein